MPLFIRASAGSLIAVFFTFVTPCGTSSAQSADSMVGKVMTVKGPIAPGALGVTLPHEHLFMDFQPPLNTPEGWIAVGARRPRAPPCTRSDGWRQATTSRSRRTEADGGEI